jgi:hypothetical protein
MYVCLTQNKTNNPRHYAKVDEATNCVITLYLSLNTCIIVDYLKQISPTNVPMIKLLQELHKLPLKDAADIIHNW